MAGVILFIGLLFNVIVGTLVLLNNSRLAAHKIFFGVALSLNAWQVANYWADRQSEFVILWNRATFVGPIFTIFLLMLFIQSLGRERLSSIKNILVGVVSVAFSVITVSTPLIIENISLRIEAGQVAGINVVRGDLYLLMIVWLLGLIIYTFYQLVLRLRKQVSIKIKKQLKSITVALGLASITGLTTNVAIPVATESTFSTQFAPLTSIVFLGIVSYGIIKHQLFDIRAVIARTLAYLFSWGLIVLLYIAVIVSVSTLVFGVSVDVDIELITYITIGLLLFYTISPLKKVFNRLTNKLFYQDAYEPQLLIDALNKDLIKSADLQLLLENSSALIERTLKTQVCLFYLEETAYSDARVIGSGDMRSYSVESVSGAISAIKNLKQKIIINDEIAEENPDEYQSLRDVNTFVIAKLMANEAVESSSIGYLILGPKKSGNSFNEVDKGLLSIVANEMVIAIQNALRYEEIQKFADTLQRKVDDATAELKHANEKLKKLDETKDDFISMASHQLRTPLTSVKGYLSMVIEGDAGEITDMQKKLLDQAFVSSQRMVFLVADLLNLSRLRTGKFVIDAVPTDLAKMVQDEVEQLKDTAKSRGVTLEYTRPTVMDKLMLDETKTRQVMMNFIDNAIYYTPSGGKIQVDLKDNEKTVEFTVKDDGIGIPKPEQSKLFTKFFRAGNAKKARPDGTGLGLFMVRKVVVAQGGTILFTSKEGQGSTFGFRFDKEKLKVPDQKDDKPINI